jgi:hypothetical protein
LICTAGTRLFHSFPSCNHQKKTQVMIPTKRFGEVFTALFAIIVLAGLAMHSTAKGAKPSGGGTITA